MSIFGKIMSAIFGHAAGATPAGGGTTAGGAAPAGGAATPSAAPAQTVDEVIAKNIQAHGGMEKIKAVNTLRNSAKLSRPTRQYCRRIPLCPGLIANWARYTLACKKMTMRKSS